MPNWVFNSLAVAGNTEQIAQLKFQVGQPFPRPHEQFNVETGEMETKEYTFSNPVFSFWNIVKPTDLEAYNKQPDHKLSIDEKLMFQTDDWYSWNARHWGTKWDVAVSNDNKYSDTEILIDESNLVIYKFNTAWSPPFPVIQELSRQYPELVVDLEYEEETGWGGEITFKNGEIINQSEYDNKCSECDSFDKMEYDEEKEVSICKECGYEW